MANHPRRNIVKDWPLYLSDFRKSHGFTQKDLADKLQISVRVVENWEMGRNKPPSYLKKALEGICEKKQ